MSITITRKRRASGTTVTVEGSTTKCVDHDKTKQHKSHTVARRAARKPADWCPNCKSKAYRDRQRAERDAADVKPDPK